MDTNRLKFGKNILSGFLSQIVLALLGIFVPRLILVSYGSEINGFLSSITDIFSYLTLLEAGVGTATLQALYAPVGKKDKNSVNAILSATCSYYNKAGIIYAAFVAIFATVYPLTIRTDISKIYLVIIIVLQGIPGAVSFFVQAKFRLLLSADGKTYVQNNISMFISIGSNVIKIALMMLGANILLVQFGYFCINIFATFIYVFYQKKNYKWLNYHSKPDYQAISQKNNAFVHEISGLVFNNTDTIILSMFCGLAVVSVYSMYGMVMGMLSNILATFSTSFFFYFGQKFNTDREEYLKLHSIYETYYMGLVFILFTVADILVVPFIKIYTRGITDVNYIDLKLPLLFVLIKLLATGRGASSQVINFAQKFKETQHQAIIEVIINIIVSLIGVQYFGIYGVLLGTIAALLYRANAMIIFANVKILKRSCFVTYRRWGICFAIFFSIRLICRLIELPITNYLEFVLYAILITIGVGIVYFSVLSLIEKRVFFDAVSLLKKTIKKD